MVEITIKYIEHDGYRVPDLGFVGGATSDWIDLYTVKDVTLREDDFCLIPLGVAMKLPEGYEAHVLPRSSTFGRYGIIMTNSMGIIDNAYCGNGDEWRFPALMLREGEVTIPRGTRIAQFRIEKRQDEVSFNSVSDLGTTNRGGFGSTGK